MVNLVGANFVPQYGGVKPPDADTKPPTVTLTSPENYTIYSTNSVSLIFNVSVGESTTASYVWIDELYYEGDWQENKTYIDLEEIYAEAKLSDRSSLLPPTFSFTLTNIPEGKHSITVYATEKGRCWDPEFFFFYWDFFINSSSSVQFTIDTIPPTVSVLQQTQNKTYDTSEVPLSFTVSELTKWVGYSLDGQTNITISGNTTLSGILDGPHSLVVYVEDTAGYTGISEPFHFAVDTTSPSISFLTPENKTYDTTDIPLNFTVNEKVSQIKYALDGQANITITGNMTLTGLSESSHNLTVYAEDLVGNIGTSETLYFSIVQEAELILLGLSLPLEYGYAFIAGTVALAAIAAYFFVKRLWRPKRITVIEEDA